MNWMKIVCLFTGHDRQFDRAKDYEEDACKRIYTDDRENVPIPGCTIVDKCQKCGDEKDITGPANVADRFNIPKEWED